MRNLKQHVTQENLTVSMSNKRCCSSSGGVGYFYMIPVDLLMNNILSRLSVKSMGKCRCVSKLWSSIIRRPNYQLFPQTIKYSPNDIPKLLFAINLKKKLYYFSSPHPAENDKSSLVATLLHTHTVAFFRFCGSISGLVCGQSWGKKYTVAVISNPVTGESVTTPKVNLKTHDIESKVKFYFGYDPIEKQYKVLRVTWLIYETFSTRHYVLTLEAGNPKWRKIQCCNAYHPLIDDGICINGVVYYTAKINAKTRMIVCFDVRSEKFSFMDVHPDLATKIRKGWVLTDYKGKLGAIIIDDDDRIEMWVLEEAKKHKWSKQTYQLNPSRHFSVGVRVTGGGKILFCREFLREDRLDIFYYDPERDSIERVEIAGFEIPGSEVLDTTMCAVHTFPHYIEDVKLI
ncbi:unnamed protein product [Microthlaspi erraticum]|uniref:F-box domain-containing protein n=1 Tax=Microthlaspi erraticum TaxID=1685480 RepID=A0A6D2HQ62_9BRAS|nr:unnamed protein product [Microthlaspi erraticum]